MYNAVARALFHVRADYHITPGAEHWNIVYTVLNDKYLLVKDTLKASNEVKDKLQEQNSSLQFQLAEQQRLAAEIGRELLATKNR